MEKIHLEGCSIIEKVSLLACFAELPLKTGESLDCFGACKELKQSGFVCSYEPESKFKRLEIRSKMCYFQIWSSGKVFVRCLKCFDDIALADGELTKLWKTVLKKHVVVV
jgi:hypothetical protein